MVIEKMEIELTSKEVGDFFESRGITWNCQVCNQEKWIAVGPAFGPNLPVVAMQVMATLGRTTLEKYAVTQSGGIPEMTIREFLNSNANISFKPIGFPVLIFVCSHCGFIRTHSASIIKNNEGDDSGDEK